MNNYSYIPSCQENSISKPRNGKMVKLMELKTNALYYGDNLKILREHFPDESVDLIYLDPPFNSKRDYNVIFKEEENKESEAQIEAFTDTWKWGPEAERTYHDIMTNAPTQNIADMIDSLIKFLGHNDLTAYLVMMTPRLIELRRVLKNTGSLYLHCDPTASHYLKTIMDVIFGKENFQNEVIWRYRRWPTKAQRFQRMHDVILFYSKSQARERDFNTLYENLAKSTLEQWGTKKQRAVFEEGKRVVSSSTEEESPGAPMSDVWEVSIIAPISKERLGYPTQKPVALLEIIIKASSNEGDVVLDPFCGCGTALVAAQKLKRKWVGIDITHLAVGLMRKRLKDSFPGLKIEVIGEPKDLSGAVDLAKHDRFQFEWWAVDLAGGRPVQDKRKGSDKGIDGVIPFLDGKEDAKKVLLQAKSGHTDVSQIRDLNGVIEREKAAIGVFITLEEPTNPMKKEATVAGFYHSETWNKDYPRTQILTVEDLLSGKEVDMPPHKEPYKETDDVEETSEILK